MDDILRDFCPFTYYQKRLTIVLGLATVALGPQAALLVFVGAPATWSCKSDDINGRSLHNISAEERCSRYDDGSCTLVFENQLSTATGEFGLVCEHETDTGYAQSLYFVGMLVGSWLAGWSSDLCGRRFAILIGGCLSLLGSSWTTLCSYMWSFAASRFLAGVGSMWMGVTFNVLLSESVAPSHRGLVTTIVNVAFSVGLCILPLLAHLFAANWRYLMTALSIWGLIGFVFVWMFISESPHWLLMSNRFTQLETMLTRWAATRGETLPEKIVQELRVGKDNVAVDDDGSSPQSRDPSVRLTALLSAGMRRVSLAMLWTWFTLCMMYYGLSLHMEGLGSNRYISFFLMSAVELPSLLLVIIGLKYIGRKTAIFWCLVCTTIFSGMSMFVAQEGSSASPGSHYSTTAANLQLAISICGKFTASAAFSILYTYTPELLPTAIRTSGLGFCVVISRIGAIISPFILNLGHAHPAWPYVVFTVFGVGSCLGMFRMPETKDKGLPETLHDMHRLVSSS